MSGPNSPRGTSNTNDRGSATARRARKQWLLEEFGDGTFVDCHACGLVLDFGTVTVDRIVPGAFGGRYVKGNIRPACGLCNSLDGTQLREAMRVARSAGVTHPRLVLT